MKIKRASNMSEGSDSIDHSHIEVVPHFLSGVREPGTEGRKIMRKSEKRERPWERKRAKDKAPSDVCGKCRGVDRQTDRAEVSNAFLTEVAATGIEK